MFTISKKLTTALALMVSAAFLVTGCGGQSASTSSSSSSSSSGGSQKVLHVSAAASLTNVMQDIAKEYEQQHPDVKVEFNFGSSGALQQAIENGGQSDLFVSAAQKQMNALEKAGLLADGTRQDLLINDVVLIVPKDSKKDIKSFEDLNTDKVQKLALGEPKGVPVGQYSEQIFTYMKNLDAMKAKAVYGTDVRQVLSWIEQGEADAGLVYATDAAITDGVKVVAKAPADSHKPIIYPVSVLKDSKQLDLAKDFEQFLLNDTSKALFEKYGFTMAK
ncbi:MAG: molybdate ABC transporter substrate-binding protein [Selenomonadaceae bacterium]|nr:molybdate ABC transporter substrate-binding protein [Selenomonadaceae bacterium]MDD7056580.1 molybdate ABC transporter substrate-binding protein [Selenomonadaceae bacterium]MDY3915274.1 molybdate ABC transporter substrate-binding protein [Selenomonadaceae bacterium]